MQIFPIGFFLLQYPFLSNRAASQQYPPYILLFLKFFLNMTLLNLRMQSMKGLGLRKERMLPANHTLAPSFLDLTDWAGGSLYTGNLLCL